jgi:SAM-dependent methyltransferase
MPIYNSKFFPESALAHQLLDGLQGIEIGGAAHNAFGLDTINVDRVGHEEPGFAPYASEQIRLCGEVMPVDVVAPGNALPFGDKSADFIISSHVIEHFYDPIGAIKEWMRVAREYIYIIAPQRDAMESDKDKPLTELQEHIARHGENIYVSTDEHHSRWTAQSFIQMCWWIFTQEWGAGWEVFTAQEKDDKVGNGFCVVLKNTNHKPDELEPGEVSEVVIYDMIGADKSGAVGHPQRVIKHYFKKRLRSECFSIGDCWLFEVYGKIQDLPDFIKPSKASFSE